MFDINSVCLVLEYIGISTRHITTYILYYNFVKLVSRFHTSAGINHISHKSNGVPALREQELGKFCNLLSTSCVKYTRVSHNGDRSTITAV